MGTGIDLTVRLDDAALDAALSRAIAEGVDLRKPMGEIAGEWILVASIRNDSFDIDNGKESPRSVARNHVDAILDGCVLREDYDQFDGMHGQSFTIWDAARGVWHQSWVTNRGQLLQLDGARHGSRITFEGDSVTPQGRQRVRVFWEPQGADVRETATVSTDAGKTWKPLFDIVFRKHRD